MPTYKPVYGSYQSISISLASLASSATKLAGRSSAVISNTTNLYEDVLISGRVRVGASPTAAKTIEVWAWSAISATPTYPDVLDGSDSAKTITSDGVKFVILQLLAAINIEAVSSRDYFIVKESIAERFGHVPDNYGIFVTHDCGVALDSNAANHAFTYQGINYESV